MSISKKLDETLSSLDLDSSAEELKEKAISKSMNTLKEKMSDMDIHIEKEENEVIQEAPKPRYGKLELADVARTIYRDNIKSRDRADKIDDVIKKDPKEQPSTMASRANLKALSRSLAGLRSSGNEGKVSQTGPNGVGNVGKLSPTDSNGIGNVTNNFNNYYALTTDMTLEEYEAYVQNIFEGDCEPCEHEVKKEKKEKEVKKEDVVYELEQRLVTLGSTDWIQVDQVLREFAEELEVAPRTLSREFKSVHGVYPDKWIKEHLNVEICGYMPLDEAARLNKIGTVYEVTFMFRGGTNRLKFFWPMEGTPSKAQMQAEVEKFWPKARLIAFYPTIDNEQQCNYMVMAPPMTESYHFLQSNDWVEMSEDVEDVLEYIYEEEGEPLSPPVMREDGMVEVTISDHESGEVKVVTFEAKNPCWDGYKRKPGTKKFAPGSCVKEEKRGLWANIHAKRNRGESPDKPGDKDYPKTLNVEERDIQEEDDGIRYKPQGAYDKFQGKERSVLVDKNKGIDKRRDFGSAMKSFKKKRDAMPPEGKQFAGYVHGHPARKGPEHYKGGPLPPKTSGGKFNRPARKVVNRSYPDALKESMYGLGKPGGAAAQTDNRYRQTKVRTAEYDKANRHAQQQKNREASAYKKRMSKLEDASWQAFADYLAENKDGTTDSL